MESSQIEEILNRHVFDEAKASLLKSIAKNPDRFVGIFRSTTPQLKLLQNLLQSREIRFGDAMEIVSDQLLPVFAPQFKILCSLYINEHIIDNKVGICSTDQS